MIKAILLFVVLVAIYIGLYVMNHRTPVPEGCEEMFHDCETCSAASGCVNAMRKDGQS